MRTDKLLQTGHWRRPADDAKHLRCGFLSLQRLVALAGELSNVRLHFVVLVGVCSEAPSYCVALA